MKKIVIILMCIIFGGIFVAAAGGLVVKYIDLTPQEVTKLEQKGIDFEESVYVTPCADIGRDRYCTAWVHDNDLLGRDPITGNKTEWPTFAHRIDIEYTYCIENDIRNSIYGEWNAGCKKWHTMTEEEIENVLTERVEKIMKDMANNNPVVGGAQRSETEEKTDKINIKVNNGLGVLP